MLQKVQGHVRPLRPGSVRRLGGLLLRWPARLSGEAGEESDRLLLVTARVLGVVAPRDGFLPRHREHYADRCRRRSALTWANFIVGAWAAFMSADSFWIDPGWEDARKEMPLLDRIARPLSGELGQWLWWTCFVLLFIETIVVVDD